MKRTHIVSLMTLIIAIPAATASSFFTSNAKPCFTAGNAGYEISGSAAANYTVRIDNTSTSPSLRMQIVDDPAAADFVLVDDSDAGDACKAATAISSIRIDPAAANPDLTVALSRTQADYKIYVRSANYSEQDAAALFAVIWQNFVNKTTKTVAASRY
jgi:hypothetical protein